MNRLRKPTSWNAMHRHMIRHLEARIRDTRPEDTAEFPATLDSAGLDPGEWGRFITGVDDIEGISAAEREEARKVAEVFPFRASEYYLSLIDWNDPNDPIRRLVVPRAEELAEWEWGSLDASNEKSYTRLPGLQHKYKSVAVLLVSNSCAGLCRYCFRKRLFVRGSKGAGATCDLREAVAYIRRHPEITNVLLTGGDSLMLPTEKLRGIVAELRGIEHVRIIRLGSRVPAFLPRRIVADTDLHELIRTYSTPKRPIYVMCHFSHTRELTALARDAVRVLRECGAVLCNQTPLIRGVNDRPDDLAALFRELSFMGVPPYYVFQCRPASGNRSFAVPLEEGYRIFEEARSKVSGLAKRARLVMSHATGKVEIVGMNDECVFFKYHRTAKMSDDHRFLVCRRNPDAYWLDDYEEVPEGALRSAF